MKTKQMILGIIVLTVFAALCSACSSGPMFVSKEAGGAYNRGLWHYKAGNYDQAIAELTVYLDAYPNDSEVLNYRGLSYLKKGDYDSAIADFNTALKAAPLNLEIRMNLSDAEKEKANPPLAAARTEAASNSTAGREGEAANSRTAGRPNEAPIAAVSTPEKPYAADPESDFRFVPVDGKAVKITGYNGNKWHIHIPPQIRGLPVTQIGERAFSGKNLISVTLPYSVTVIDDFAFTNNQITSITLGENVSLQVIYGFGGSVYDPVGDGFNTAYNRHGKKAGTYTKPGHRDTNWTKQ